MIAFGLIINNVNPALCWISGALFRRGWLIFVTAWMSNYILNIVWGKITYPFPNFNGKTVKLWEWINNLILHFTGHINTYPCWDLIKSTFVKWPQWFILIFILTQSFQCCERNKSKFKTLFSQNWNCWERAYFADAHFIVFNAVVTC